MFSSTSCCVVSRRSVKISRFFDFKDVDHPSVCHLVFSRTFRNFWKSKIVDGWPSENRKIENRDILVTVWPIAEKFVTVTNFILSNREIWYDAKFALIGQTVTEISRYFDTQDGGCLLSWIFKNFSELENTNWRMASILKIETSLSLGEGVLPIATKFGTVTCLSLSRLSIYHFSILNLFTIKKISSLKNQRWQMIVILNTDK